MPNIWTHQIFGRQVLEQSGHSSLIETKAQRNLFQMGCQGPDFLFYHHFLPWHQDKRMNRLGSAMHQTRCGPFLLDLIRWVSGRPIHSPGPVYVLGFVLHHVLDRNMHPYIFYKSGFKKWDHQRLEVIIDTLIARKYESLETWRTPVWKEIETGGRFPDDIADMLDSIAKLHYPEETAGISAEDWNQANRDMIAAQRLFHDPTGLKRLLTFRQIEPLVYKRKVPARDYLNEANQPWSCPTDRNDVHTSSFWDLWETAFTDGIEVVREVISVWQDDLKSSNEAELPDESLDTLKRVIGNRSYETGKDCELELIIQFADPIL